MKQEYSSTLLAMQLAVQERMQVFPWLLDGVCRSSHDRNGRVVIPSGVMLSFAKIDQRLEDLLLDSDDAEWEIADPAKVIMIVNALTDDQRMKLINSLRSKLPGLGGQLDLRQIDYATLKKELEWFASFDRDAEIKARQRQSGGRERAFRGQQRRGRGSGGFRNQENRQNGKSPNTSVFGVKAARPISSISVGDRVFVTDPRPIPSSAVPVRGKEGFFAGVESDSVVCVLVKTNSEKGWRPLRVHPSAVFLIEWYGLNVSSNFLNGVSKSAAAPADDVDRFSDFNVDEDREVDVLAAGGADPEAVVSSSKSQAIFPDSVPSAAVRQLDRIMGDSVFSVSAPVLFPPSFAAGSQLQAGHLELRGQQ
uniref:Uncharacterized protein n=1 Tax=Chromera velia CCMP2878 TaxID=1169474 RepID=A0A0G4G5L0_9ALVE|eukprot:Cvel_20310.t1-p1 / transcript=Cvel_20310.t1 / gene=Cvel_20310 / organism=Chromera_velia_CCMP2878 / gene_product=hypothetical protein / transcript_product=hypothetical protein / location=Cvel_scaffold1813:31370-34130(-) / protein_length=364 / sequence_SO=supercontig / SO=protein_coding / is_pseudo=false